MATVHEFPAKTDDKADPYSGVSEGCVQKIGTIVESNFSIDSSARQMVEERWVENVRQYNGMSRADENEAEARAQKRSTVVASITRNLTNVGEARLADMVLPVDERMWDLKADLPAPIVDLADPESLTGDRPGVNPETGEPYVDETGAAIETEQGQAQRIVERETRKAKAMTDRLDSIFADSDVPSVFRSVIHKAAVMGTGLIKGPVSKGIKTVVNWEQGEDGRWRPVKIRTKHPSWSMVDPWHFWPDADALDIGQCTRMHERILMTPVRLERYARIAGWNPDHVQTVLDQGPNARTTNNGYYLEYRQLTTRQAVGMENLYEVICTPHQFHVREFGDTLPDWWDEDMQWGWVEVWHVNGQVMEIRPPILETEESTYIKWCWEPDPSSFWGFGTPELMKTSARIMTGALRATMTNAALSQGPNAIVNEQYIEPVDGQYTIDALKVWRFKRSGVRVAEALAFVDIPSRTQEFMQIIELGKQLAHEEANQPPLVAGEGSKFQTDKVGGLAILQNNINIVDRRRVKSFIDGPVRGTVSRAYDFEMQEGEDESIKGNYRVITQNSTEIIQKFQGAAVAALSMELTGHPVFGPMHRPYETLRHIYKALHVDPTDFIEPKDKALQLVEQARGSMQQGKLSPEEIAIKEQEIQVQAYKVETEAALREQEMRVRLAEVSGKQEIAAEQLKANVFKIEMDFQSFLAKTKTERDKVAAEINLKREMGSGI